MRSSAERKPELTSADLDPAPWQATIRRLEQVARLNPWNAEYAAELGRYYAWLAWRHHGNPRKFEAFRNASELHYRAAIRLRPTWGFAWINLAEARMLGGYEDETTLHALRRAMELAPFEPATQLKVLLVGFSLWESLQESTRVEVRATLRRALFLNNHVDQIIRYAFQTNRAAEVSAQLRQKNHVDLYERIKAQIAAP